MVSDETLDKLGITLLILTLLNVVGLMTFILLSAYNEVDFSEELSSIALGSFELTFTITKICFFGLFSIILFIILLFAVSSKKINN